MTIWTRRPWGAHESCSSILTLHALYKPGKISKLKYTHRTNSHDVTMSVPHTRLKWCCRENLKCAENLMPTCILHTVQAMTCYISNTHSMVTYCSPCVLFFLVFFSPVCLSSQVAQWAPSFLGLLALLLAPAHPGRGAKLRNNLFIS